MNILHVVQELNVGGLEHFLLDFVSHLPKEIRTHIVCIEKKGSITNKFQSVPVFELKKPQGLHVSYAFRIAKLIRKHRIDLVHTHNPSAHFYGSLAGFLTRVPVIHTKHGRNHPDDRNELILEEVSNRLTKIIVPVSDDAAALCVSQLHIDPAKVSRIYNGIDLSGYGRSRRKLGKLRRLGIPDECIVAGMVARICEDKDHRTLLDSLKWINLAQNEFHLLIIGDGPLRQETERFAEASGVEDRVTFAGMRYDVPELLEELDLCVLSTHTEGHSISLLEAMAASLPCIATAVGGNPEVVDNGVTGFLVPHKDPKALAGKILRLVKNTELMREMGGAGRRRAEALFDIRQTVIRYVEHYRSLTGMR